MQRNISFFDRRVRNLFLALILSCFALAARADEPPVCEPSAPPEQCTPADDLPQEVDSWEDDLPGKSGATGHTAVTTSAPGPWRAALARMLDTARRLVNLGLGDLVPEPSLLQRTLP